MLSDINIEDLKKEFEDNNKGNAYWHGAYTKSFVDWCKKVKGYDDAILKTLEILETEEDEITEEDEQELLDVMKDLKDKTVENHINEALNLKKENSIKEVNASKTKVVQPKSTQKKIAKKKVIVKKSVEPIQSTVTTNITEKKTLKHTTSKIEKPELEDDNTVAKIFTSPDETLWKTIEEEEKKKIGKKRTKGFFAVVSGETKTGKTRFGLSACKFKGLSGNHRTIPKGYPVYVIAFDDDPRDEAERSFPEEIGKNIFFINCYVEDKETGLIDPVASLAMANKYIFALKDKEEGTLFIDDYSFYCALMLFSFLKNSATVKDNNTKKQRSITFDEFMKPDKKIMIFEYQYKNRTMTFVLRKLKNFTINIIFGVQVKPEYDSSKDDSGFGKTTGKLLEDMQKGTDQWVDIIARLLKIKEGEIMRRKLVVSKSRFEGKEVILKNVTLNAPDYKDLMEKIVREYL